MHIEWSRCQLFGMLSNAHVVVYGGDAVTATKSLPTRPSTCHTILKMSCMRVLWDKSMLMLTSLFVWSTLVEIAFAMRTFHTAQTYYMCIPFSIPRTGLVCLYQGLVWQYQCSTINSKVLSHRWVHLSFPTNASRILGVIPAPQSPANARWASSARSSYHLIRNQ